MDHLLRQATELLDARQKVCVGDWGYIDDYTEYFDNACAVIEGYQELLRCLVKMLDHGVFYDATTVSNLEFAIEGEEQVNQLLMAIVKAKAALPKESSGENR